MKPSISPSAPSIPAAKKPKYLIDLEDQIQEEKRAIEYWKALSWAMQKTIREWKEDQVLADENLKKAEGRLKAAEEKMAACVGKAKAKKIVEVFG